jgi:hypothetical protein
MAKNRRKNKLRVKPRKPGVRGIFPGTLLSALLGLGIFAISYLTLCSRCDAIGRRINELEKVHENLKREIVNEEFKWSKLTDLQSMEILLAHHGLEMIWPSEDSVVRLHRNPPPHLMYAREPGYGDVVHD